MPKTSFTDRTAFSHSLAPPWVGLRKSTPDMFISKSPIFAQNRYEPILPSQACLSMPTPSVAPYCLFIKYFSTAFPTLRTPRYHRIPRCKAVKRLLCCVQRRPNRSLFRTFTASNRAGGMCPLLAALPLSASRLFGRVNDIAALVFASFYQGRYYSVSRSPRNSSPRPQWRWIRKVVRVFFFFFDVFFYFDLYRRFCRGLLGWGRLVGLMIFHQLSNHLL
ncbi:hypothetical protein F4823DRAFT_583454 [Ustulina deusta]|nr:hypothetical protein F4823DRAFT_583454 [Ustulina deusta]